MKMKKKLVLVIPFLIVGLFSLFIISCDKEEEKDISLPEVTTAEVTNIGIITAEGGGEVTSDGGTAVFRKGVCYSTSTGPTLDDDFTMDGVGRRGGYTSKMTNLEANTTYYVRAYATNQVGDAYGNEVSFTTNPIPGVDCVAEIWSGDLDVKDLIWPTYPPSYCTGALIDEDCSKLKLTLDFWGYGVSTEVSFDLGLGDYDTETYEGELTLLKNAYVTAEGIPITFFAGEAGTYKILTKELHIEINWEGDGTSETYKFLITPK